MLTLRLDIWESWLLIAWSSLYDATRSAFRIATILSTEGSKFNSDGAMELPFTSCKGKYAPRSRSVEYKALMHVSRVEKVDVEVFHTFKCPTRNTWRDASQPSVSQCARCSHPVFHVSWFLKAIPKTHQRLQIPGSWPKSHLHQH